MPLKLLLLTHSVAANRFSLRATKSLGKKALCLQWKKRPVTKNEDIPGCLHCVWTGMNKNFQRLSHGREVPVQHGWHLVAQTGVCYCSSPSRPLKNPLKPICHIHSSTETQHSKQTNPDSCTISGELHLGQVGVTVVIVLSLLTAYQCLQSILILSVLILSKSTGLETPGCQAG